MEAPYEHFGRSVKPEKSRILPGSADHRYVYHRVLIQEATRLLREACAIRHLSLNTEKTYAYWLERYCAFLKIPNLKVLSSEKKIEAYLTKLALSGVSGSTQNQAFNAILFFYRCVLSQELSNINALAPNPTAARAPTGCRQNRLRPGCGPQITRRASRLVSQEISHGGSLTILGLVLPLPHSLP